MPRRRAVFILVVCLGYAPLRAQQAPQAQNPQQGSSQTAETNSTPASISPKPSGSHEDADDLIKLLDEETSSNNNEGPAGIVPVSHGFNASMVTTSQHDSAGGWSNIVTPNVAWRFNKYFTVNSQVPIYTYLNVSVVTGQIKLAGVVIGNTYALDTQHFLVGDTTIAGGFEIHPKFMDYNLTATLGTPTGDFLNGLGAGQYTYNINNHFEHQFFDWLTPDIELGIGDSSSLIHSSIRKDFVAVGEQAHFQAGLSVSLPWFNANFSSDAYEDMPLSRQTVTTITNQGKKGAIKLVKSSTQESIGEDNGFANSLDFPLASHLTFSAFYNRSLLNHDDTVGFSLALLLRSIVAHTTK